RVVVDQCVDDLARLLGRRGVVEIDQRVAVDASVEDWKVGPDTTDVDRRGSINPQHSEIIPKWSEFATAPAMYDSGDHGAAWDSRRRAARPHDPASSQRLWHRRRDRRAFSKLEIGRAHV